MPHKNKCSKCGHKHFPPTGKKCRMGIDNSARESDSDMNLQELSNMQKCNKTQSGTTSGVADYNGDVSEEENRSSAVTDLSRVEESKRQIGRGGRPSGEQQQWRCTSEDRTV